MAVRNIYVHPGDLLCVHIVADKDVKPSKAEYDLQGLYRGGKVLLTIHGRNEIGYSDFSYKFRLDNVDGTLRRWLD